MKKKILTSFIAFNFIFGGTFVSAKSFDVNAKYPPLSTTLPSAIPEPIEQINFGACNKFFKLDSDKLFFITLAAVNANRFKIEEIQSKSGYIMFSVGQKQYLAICIKVDANHSLLRITPCDNLYYFPIGIVQNMFKYVELNQNTQIENLSGN